MEYALTIDSPLTGIPTAEEYAHAAALKTIARVDAIDAREDAYRRLVYLYRIAWLKAAHPGYFDHVPENYEPAYFEASRREAFGSTPKHVVEQFLFGGPLCESTTEPTSEKVH